MRRMWTFIVIVCFITFGIVFYVGAHLTMGLPEGSPFRPLIWILLGLWGVGLISSRVVGHALSSKALSLFLKGSYAFMGFLLLLVTLFFITDISGFLHVEISPWIAVGGAFLLSLWGYFEAIKSPEIVRVKVPKKDLHPSLEGFKIAQISDLHVSPSIGESYVERVRSIVEGLKADVVVLTGDVVDGDINQLRSAIEPFRNMKSAFGTFMITGNHEYFWNAPAWLEEFRKIGFRVLINEHVVVEKNNAKLMITGLPDLMGGRFHTDHKIDIGKALRDAPEVDYHVLLAHQPQNFKSAEKMNVDLQLSGHTHSGQFFPANLFIGLFHKYYRGLNKHNEQLWVYVNRGTGYWGPPNRLGVPAEITLLELTLA